MYRLVYDCFLTLRKLIKRMKHSSLKLAQKAALVMSAISMSLTVSAPALAQLTQEPEESDPQTQQIETPIETEAESQPDGEVETLPEETPLQMESEPQEDMVPGMEPEPQPSETIPDTEVQSPTETEEATPALVGDPSQNLVAVAASAQQFSTLVSAIEAAGLQDTLANQGPFTIFAPTDEAFNQLPSGALEYLLQQENQDLLSQILTYHVVSGTVTASELTSGSVDTLGGGVAIEVTPERVIVNNASVVNPDIQAQNGVIHAVSRVLMPAAIRERLLSELQAQ